MEIVVGEAHSQPGAYTPQQSGLLTATTSRGTNCGNTATPGSNHTASSDVPIQVYDLDGDGKAEVFANMSTTEMTVLDGTTGKLLRKIPLPTRRRQRLHRFCQSERQEVATGHHRQDPLFTEWAMGLASTHTRHTPTTTAGTVLWQSQDL